MSLYDTGHSSRVLLSAVGMPNFDASAAESSTIPGLADSLYLDMLTDHRRNCAYAACLEGVIRPGTHKSYTLKVLLGSVYAQPMSLQ